MYNEVYQVSPKDLPGGLQHLPDAPETLFVRGALPPEDHKLLCVVGSRVLSEYGRHALAYMIRGLEGCPISIVSGLALGADGLAHALAMKYGLHTIAIPGSGISDDVIYPRRHLSLAHSILENNGALISEYPEDFKAQIWSFPKRNRLMAGMSDAVFMVEAGEKSGTLITARMASEYNKELCTIPHSIFTKHGKGSLQFLRLGATLVSEPEHLLEALGLKQEETNTISISLRPLEKKVYVLLEKPRSLEEIASSLSLSKEDVLAITSSLELKGLIRIEAGLYTCVRSQKT